MEIATSRLRRLDDVQTGLAPWAVVAVVVAGDLFCAFDQGAPWSLLCWLLGVGVASASIALHGIWRLAQPERSALAVAALAAGLTLLVGSPYFGLALGLRFVMAMLPTVLGLLLWYRILDQQAGAAERS